MAIGDRLTVLRDGRRVAQAEAADASVGLDRRADARSRRSPGPPRPAAPGAARPAAARGRGLSLRAGRRPASSSTTSRWTSAPARSSASTASWAPAARSSSSASPAPGPRAPGEIRLSGEPVAAARPAGAPAARHLLVPEDRQGAALFPSLSVAHNMTLASLRAHVRRLGLSPSAERETVARMACELAIASGRPEIRIGALSGGNQQKVVIARALLTRPRVLLLDEPTRGVDVGAKAELRALVRRLAAGGRGDPSTSRRTSRRSSAWRTGSSCSRTDG